MSDNIRFRPNGERASAIEAKALVMRAPTRVLVILLFLGLLILPVAIPLRVVVLACLALLWTLVESRNLEPLGLGRRRVASTVIWGVGLAVAVTAAGEIIQPLIDRISGMRSDLSGYGALAGNAEAAIRLLGFALISASLGEEILFRGFLLNQLTGILGTGDRARWISIVVSGGIFGLAHMIQGLTGVISTGVVGMIFGWGWFRSGRNLWALIFAHALVDTYGITMLFLGRLS